VLGCARFSSSPANETEPWLAWHAPLGHEDALVGRIYDPALHRFVLPSEAIERARRSDFVLLGEKHDNPDHHRLQAWLIDALVRAGGRPAVAFEMIPRDRAGALAASIETHPADPDALGAALDWAHSGWPDFSLYRPIFASALAARLPIVPGDLARKEYTRLRHGGLDALPEAERARLALDPPLSDQARHALADEVRAGHCGMAPEAMVDAMINVQRVRDAELADALLGAASVDGAVLIAGAGHVRKDRGAPLYLARRAPQKSVLALAFIEVPGGPAETAEPAERASQLGLEFDLVWFTARVDDEDPCERFRHELERLRAPKPAPQARAR
jgi:uncharacterized iron-regulated protein